ncbi:MAG: hypothetical protein GXP32_06585, partial [Kiritimatiellaeota bacterium]|nr:hypothetical protein [Kiritimatiellota bacterium]
MSREFDFQETERLFKSHRYLDAAALVPRDAEPETRAEALLAIRLASRLGNDRLADFRTLEATKKFPDDQLISLYKFIWKMKWSGKFKAYIASREFIDSDYDNAKIATYHLCTAALLSADLHFFDEAGEILEQAEALEAETTWLVQTTLRVDDLRDDRESASSLIDSLLERYTGGETTEPQLISAICQHLWKYGESDRVFELMDVLEAGGCQYYYPFLIRSFFLQEKNEYDKAKILTERIERDYARYFDRKTLQSISALKFKHAQVKGDVNSMRSSLEKLRGEYHRIIEKNIAAAQPGAERIVLDVPL